MWSYRFVLRDVSCVIEGFSVDGVSRLPKAVSFTKRRDVVDAAVSLTQVLYTIVGATQRSLADDPAARTAIVFKLLAFLTRTGRVAPDAVRASIQDIAGVATLLSERPELIVASVNFANILARYTQAQQERAASRQAQAKAEHNEAPPPMPRRRRRVPIDGGGNTPAGRAREAPATVPGRPVVWRSADGQYCLQELIHPWHLVEETRALGHCIGRHPSNYCANGRNLQHLTYWQRIESGQSRIFSFACQRGPNPSPLCTLHIRLPGYVLVEAGPERPRVLAGEEPYFAALAASLDGLETTLGRKLCIGTGPSLYSLRCWREGPPGEDVEPRRIPRHGGRRLDT